VSPSRERPAIEFSDDARKQAIASIKRYFDENMDDKIGDLKAALVLDYILAELGPTIYNAAIADARGFFEERIADLAAVSYRNEFPVWPGPRRRV
jgi:uncharacterized protein (DUF2164 family)